MPSRQLRRLAPKPPSSPPPPPDEEGEDSDILMQEQTTLMWPAERPPERPRPRRRLLASPGRPPPSSPPQSFGPQATPYNTFPTSPRYPNPWTDQQPATIAPSLLYRSPEQREASVTPVQPRRGRPPYQQSSPTQYDQPLRALAPRPGPNDLPQPPQQSAHNPSPSHRRPLRERPHLYPSLSLPAPSAEGPRYSLGISGHPFWGANAREFEPCDEDGTIREAYRNERLQELAAAMRRDTNPPPCWTVRHTQEVCADVHRMPRAIRLRFGDLHKQLRELYELHEHATRLYPPPWGHPDDVVRMMSGGVTTELPRVLCDFIGGMNEHLLRRWRPFARAHPEWNVHSKIAFLEDFSCFLRFHNKFYAQRVILMQSPGAPGWESQAHLRFYEGVPYRGYQERLDMGVTSDERSRDSFVDTFWDT